MAATRWQPACFLADEHFFQEVHDVRTNSPTASLAITEYFAHCHRIVRDGRRLYY